MRATPFLLAAAVLAAAPAPASPDAAALSAEARGIVKGFFTALKGELQAAMTAGGPVHAVAVCNERAPRIAASVAGESGWEVGRTSSRLRNPANAPDDWERMVLAWFEARRDGGEDPANMEYAEVVQAPGGPVFRYMKAIPQGEVCMVCHGGASVPAAVADRIDELYPADRARGFAPGDVRGAFTLSRDL